MLLGFTALAASLAPPEPRRTASSAATPAPAPREPGVGDAEMQVVSAEETDQEIEAEVGRRLRVEVTSRELGSVQLGEDGPIESIQPDSPARFDVLPDRPGEIELAVIEPRRVIARVVVR